MGEAVSSGAAPVPRRLPLEPNAARVRHRCRVPPHDFGIGWNLKNLPALEAIGFAANRRLLDVETVAQDCVLAEGVFDQVTQPQVVDGQRPPQPQANIFASMMKINRLLYLVSALLYALTGTALADVPLNDSFYACGGQLESKVWQLWNDSARSYLVEKDIKEQLSTDHDTYALYEIQNYLHNLVSMATRCKRDERLIEIANTLKTTYGELTPFQDGKSGRAWICRGGTICSSKANRFNHEVQLTSVQFLGLMSSLAVLLSKIPSSETQTFVSETTAVILEHLSRWSGPKPLAQTLARIPLQASVMTPDDKGSSFSDKDLWLIAIYSNLAGIANGNVAMERELQSDKPRFEQFRRHYGALLQLFNARTSFDRLTNKRGEPQLLADLDKGFWRYVPEQRYAGYLETLPPAKCENTDGTQPQLTVNVEKNNVPIVDTVGWDFSHARRLVHAVNAIDMNREAAGRIFGVSTQLPNKDIRMAFANQIVYKVWNGDTKYPLFSNYLNGTNGWYRVGYDNGRGRCMVGKGPYGLSVSFPTGGYAEWGDKAHKLTLLGRRLYELSETPNSDDMRFIKKYYSALSNNASPERILVSRLAFWPSLVGNIGQ